MPRKVSFFLLLLLFFLSRWSFVVSTLRSGSNIVSKFAVKEFKVPLNPVPTSVTHCGECYIKPSTQNGFHVRLVLILRLISSRSMLERSSKLISAAPTSQVLADIRRVARWRTPDGWRVSTGREYGWQIVVMSMLRSNRALTSQLSSLGGYPTGSRWWVSDG